MFPTNRDIVELVAWRHRLHAMPELSGQEMRTAAEVQRFLSATRADRVLTGLGGHGVAAVFEGAAPGPTLMFRAELDALPIAEDGERAYRSEVPGMGHQCGHDGHMASLAGLALGLSRQPPARGRVVLMFQPAEETGAGAAAVIADPRFSEIRPDMAFSYHNRPGLRIGEVALADGPVNCASRGMRIVLTGSTAHASSPDDGRSPMAAIAGLMPALAALRRGTHTDADFAMVTVTHARMGEPTFGIAPGIGEVWCTLRTQTTGAMAALVAEAEGLARRFGQGLDVSIGYDDVFDHCENAPEAVAILRRALLAEGLVVERFGLPSRGSEDFGRFGQGAPAAMFFLGAGEALAPVHTPGYDFPDELIGIGARVHMRVVRDVLG
jgi:amidohydrolase